MSKELISRKSVLDYIEKEILKVKGTEALCVLRALSVHIEEFEPTAFEIDKVVKELEEEAERQLQRGIQENETACLYASSCYNVAVDVVKAGGIDE